MTYEDVVKEAHKISAEGNLGKADILKKLINSGKKAEKKSK